MPDAPPGDSVEQPDWRHELAARLPRQRWRTRFAPAPTGFLHLGHLVNAMYVWGVARAYGGEVLFRIEDHDQGRCRPEYEAALLDDLDWLGLIPDRGDSESYRDNQRTHALRQSNNGARYAHVLGDWSQHGLVYPCRCSRRTVAEYAAHTGDDPRRYPGICRGADVSADSTLARRVRVPDTPVVFNDLRLGVHTQRPQAESGDVLLRDVHGNWTYQFAVTVDDVAQHIDVIIRGEDLLESTGRQWQMAHLLGRTTMPHTLHHALLRRPDGTKLSKANHDIAIRERRAKGASAAQLFGEVALAIGLATSNAPIDALDLATLFTIT